jgi:hypothetical protein
MDSTRFTTIEAAVDEEDIRVRDAEDSGVGVAVAREVTSVEAEEVVVVESSVAVEVASVALLVANPPHRALDAELPTVRLGLVRDP